MAAINPLQKPYELHLERRPRYLFVQVAGEQDTLEISLQYWQEIVAEVQAHPVNHLLVWEDFDDTVTTLDMYSLVNQLCQFEEFRQMRVAFVDEHLDQLDRNKLAEMVAVNRGFSARVFTKFEEAEKWLLLEL